MKVFKYINLKVSTEFHQMVKIQAAEEGISMTEYINNKINKKETPDKKFTTVTPNPPTEQDLKEIESIKMTPSPDKIYPQPKGKK